MGWKKNQKHCHYKTKRDDHIVTDANGMPDETSIAVWPFQRNDGIEPTIQNEKKIPGIVSDPSTNRINKEREAALQAARECYDSAKKLHRAKEYVKAYHNYLRALKIITAHGSIRHPYDGDLVVFRFYQNRCCMVLLELYLKNKDATALQTAYKAYDYMIKADPAHPCWVRKRGLMEYYFFKNHTIAFRDLVTYIRIGQNAVGNLPRDEKIIYKECCEKASQRFTQNIYNNMRDCKPFLTSDWINLWALCPCDDILFEDLLSVSEELKNPEKKSYLMESLASSNYSVYKEALKGMASGYHSLAAKILSERYKLEKGPHRVEAYLLQALIYSQASECLDKFISCWDIDQYNMTLRRRKQIFMRYMSLARAVLYDPFEDLDLSMFSSQECVQFYLQTALTIILGLQIFEKQTETDKFKKANLRRLINIETFCKRAIKVDENCFYAGMLKAYTELEIELAETMNRMSRKKFDELILYIDTVRSRCKQGHRIFGLWCICSASFATGKLTEFVKHARKLEKHLLFPGFISAFLINMECKNKLEGKAIHDGIFDTLAKVDGMLKVDPENFRLHICAAECYYHLNLLEIAREYLQKAVHYWPQHIMIRQLSRLIFSAFIVETLCNSDKYVADSRNECKNTRNKTLSNLKCGRDPQVLAVKWNQTEF